MDIEELYKYISEVADELPASEAARLIEIRDSLEAVGPNEWSLKIAAFANEMLKNNIGNYEKLIVLESEAENCTSIEIKPTYIFLMVILVAFLILYF